jgi:formate dehydrogenase major subunit
MVQLTINGKKIEAKEGTTVLNAAREGGIVIPTLCDHPKLTPYGGCRLCVVEVEGMRTPQTACTLPVSNGMVVQTDTPKMKDSRKFILSMLFSERNHFCMYCQVSGGECDLQNAALAEGMDHWPLQPNWVNFPVDSSHPYFVLDHNRCILCRRCVRACAEMTGNFTLASENRGAHTMIIADFNVPLGESTCVSCGNCVQSCPTGALIDRQSAYRGLAPDADHIKSTCIGCSVGCGIDLIVRDNQLLRIEGDYDAPVNAGMMCELGRFKPVFDKYNRIRSPMVRKNGILKAATWDEALQVIGAKMKETSAKSSASMAAIASTRLPVEALSAFKELFIDQMKSKQVTSIEESYPTHGLDEVLKTPQLHGDLESIKTADCVIAIGVDMFKSHQVAGFFIKQNLSKGTKLIVIDAGENQMADQADVFVQSKPGSDVDLLMGLMGKISPEEVNKLTYVPAKAFNEMRLLIESAQRPVFIYGKGLIAQEVKGVSRSALKALLELAAKSQGKVFSPKGKANSLAAHAYDLDQPFIAEGINAVYLALGDDEVSENLLKRLENVPFIAVQTAHESKLTARADVVLPSVTWTEQTGHYLSMEGRLQEAKPGLKPPEGVRSNSEILEALAKAGGFSLKADWKSNLKKYIWE